MRLKTDLLCSFPTYCAGFRRLSLEGICCAKPLPNTRTKGAFKGFEEAFREYGLPDRIRTDNGVPFATMAIARLSALSVWFIRLGIYPEFIEPGKPQQNGRHERMHRTLKAETTKPPESSMLKQQKRFNAFQAEYNFERPHEAIKMATPGSLYKASARRFPEKLPEMTYPTHFINRLVMSNGTVSYHGRRILLSQVLSGQQIGMEEIDHGIFNFYFGQVLLGKWCYDKPYVEGLTNHRRQV